MSEYSDDIPVAAVEAVVQWLAAERKRADEAENTARILRSQISQAENAVEFAEGRHTDATNVISEALEALRSPEAADPETGPPLRAALAKKLEDFLVPF